MKDLCELTVEEARYLDDADIKTQRPDFLSTLYGIPMLGTKQKSSPPTDCDSATILQADLRLGDIVLFCGGSARSILPYMCHGFSDHVGMIFTSEDCPTLYVFHASAERIRLDVLNDALLSDYERTFVRRSSSQPQIQYDRLRQFALAHVNATCLREGYGEYSASCNQACFSSILIAMALHWAGMINLRHLFPVWPVHFERKFTNNPLSAFLEVSTEARYFIGGKTNTLLPLLMLAPEPVKRQEVARPKYTYCGPDRSLWIGDLSREILPLIDALDGYGIANGKVSTTPLYKELGLAMGEPLFVADTRCNGREAVENWCQNKYVKDIYDGLMSLCYYDTLCAIGWLCKEDVKQPPPTPCKSEDTLMAVLRAQEISEKEAKVLLLNGIDSVEVLQRLSMSQLECLGLLPDTLGKMEGILRGSAVAPTAQFEENLVDMGIGSEDITILRLCGIKTLEQLEASRPSDLCVSEHALERLSHILRREECPVAPSAASVGKSKKQASHDYEMDEKACKVCFVNDPNMLYLPCRHNAVCSECDRLIKDCPICRCEIKDRINFYRS